MDLIAELPTISGRSLTDLGCRVKRVANECRAIALVHVGCVKSSEHTGIPWGNVVRSEASREAVPQTKVVVPFSSGTLVRVGRWADWFVASSTSPLSSPSLRLCVSVVNLH